MDRRIRFNHRDDGLDRRVLVLLQQRLHRRGSDPIWRCTVLGGNLLLGDCCSLYALSAL